MNKEEINTLTQVVTSLTTFIGVGGTIAYYLHDIKSINQNTFILVLMFYIPKFSLIFNHYV